MKTCVLVQIRIILIFNTYDKGLNPNGSGFFIYVEGELFYKSLTKQNFISFHFKGRVDFLDNQ